MKQVIKNNNNCDLDITVKILYGVIYERKYSNLYLNEVLSQVDDQKSKARITNLVYTSLRNYMLFDSLVNDSLTTRIKKLTRLTIIVSLGKYFFSNNSKGYAIVSQTVNYLKENTYDREAKIANAILRKNMDDYKNISDLKQKFPTHLYYSIEEWMYNLLVKQYGFDTTVSILENFNCPAKLYARVLPNHKLSELHQEYDVKVIDEKIGCVLFPGSEILKAMQEKLVYIQDFSSQNVAIQFSDLNEKNVLDMCSAPGGKLNHLASIFTTAQIIANDIHPHKVRILESMIQKYDISNVQVICQDATNLTNVYDHEYFDAILLDAPCSGIGVIKHKPEIKYRIKPTDLDSLQKLQSQLLDAAYLLLKPGGQLVYSTCTLNKKENEKQIDAFLKKHADIDLITEKTILGIEHESDGSYYCKLIKRG